MRGWRRLFWLVVAGGLLTVVLTDVPAAYVVGPLVGLAIMRVGIASWASMRVGPAHVPQGPPVPVDTSEERTTYGCEGCGAEVLLVIRGADVPPRHCGERMVERREVPHDS